MGLINFMKTIFYLCLLIIMKLQEKEIHYD